MLSLVFLLSADHQTDRDIYIPLIQSVESKDDLLLFVFNIVCGSSNRAAISKYDIPDSDIK